MTRKRISFTFERWDISRDILFISLQNGSSFVKAAVACMTLETVSGFEPWSRTTPPIYLKIVTSFCPFTLISLWMPLALFFISMVFSALIPILYLVQVLLRLSARASCSCSSSTSYYSIYVIGKLQINNISAAYAILSIMFRYDLLNQNVEEGGWLMTSFLYSDCSEPFSHAVIHLDCTFSLVVELLNGVN